MIKPDELYAQRKVRVLGKVEQKAETRNTAAWVTIHDSSKTFLLTYESKGLVVAINGGGGLKASHPAVQDGVALAKAVVEKGGCVLNAGRDTGIMQAVAEEVKDKCLGVLHAGQKAEANKFGPKVVVNMPAPRVELMAVSPPIVVVFQGGLGTFQILIRSIVNLTAQDANLPQMLFVSSYWIPLLDTLCNLGIFSRKYLEQVYFFSSAEDIIAKIPGLQ